MDWSALFDDTGDDENENVKAQEFRVSRLSRNLRTLSFTHSFEVITRTVSFTDLNGEIHYKTLYSPFVAYLFTVNYILGVGSLGIPYAFQKSGILLGIGMILVVSLVSFVTVMWINDVCEKAHTIRTQIEQKRKSNEVTSLVEHDEQLRKLPEVIQLCQVYLGKTGTFIYQISLIGLMYAGLLGYSQVFLSSVSTQLHGWIHLEHFEIALIFAVVVVPLSCADLVDQIHIQVTMAIVRFISLGIMLFGALFAIFADRLDNNSSRLHPPYTSDYSLVNFSGFGLVFSTALFSQLFQHSVPGLVTPLSSNDKPKVSRIFGGALLTTASIYIFLGMLCCVYFGDSTRPSVNLNWADFSWGISKIQQSSPFYATFLSGLVVLFPAFDTLSIFPLIAITLGDNLAVTTPLACLKSAKHHSILWRLAAAIPPLVCSVFAGDLSLTLQFSGIFGLYVAFFAPALLKYFSLPSTILQERNDEIAQDNDMKREIRCSKIGVTLVIGFGSIALVILVAQIIHRFRSNVP